MNIAFLAPDKKKELMVQFCTAYKSVLNKHNLFATATTGRLIADNTGLPLTLLLSHKQGGKSRLIDGVGGAVHRRGQKAEGGIQRMRRCLIQGIIPLAHIQETQSALFGHSQGDVQIPQADVAIDAQNLLFLLRRFR